MQQISRDIVFESTLPLLLDPYRFISRRCRRRRSELLKTRLLFKKTILMTGEECARAFYDELYFERAGAQLLFRSQSHLAPGGIQTLDGLEHRRRKGLFMTILDADGVRSLVERTSRIWGAYLERWTRQRRIVLYPELQRVFAESVCRWAGVHVEGRDAQERTAQLALLFQKASRLGFGNRRARKALGRAEKWIARLIEDARRNVKPDEEDTPLGAMARYTDAAGRLLDPRTAAANVIDLLRPTVAVSVYATLCAHALHAYPACRERISAGDGAYVEHFVHEVRRFYPFYPLVVARTRTDFVCSGFQVPKGWTAVLDLYGTNRDPRVWSDPDKFDPERFSARTITSNNMAAHGGGELLEQHRCAGEALTVLLMKLAVEFLARRMSYDVPKQDLRLNMRLVPALPKSGFVMANVHRAGLSESGVEE